MAEYFAKRFVKEDGMPGDDQYHTNLGYVEVFAGHWMDVDEEPEWYLEPLTIDLGNRIKELSETILDQNKEIENLKRIVKQKTPRRLVDED